MLLNKIKNLLAPDHKKVPEHSSEVAMIQAYMRSRTIHDKRYICHAPFNNMYFNSVGDVANCWLTFDDPEKYDASKTIMQIWQGEKFAKLRNEIKNQNLDYRCGTCKHNLETGNFVNVLARAYDNDRPLSDFPSMMEFELSNTCNLECTMCTGLLSSSIRKNRDKLPAIKSPYGDKFVQELAEFIPYLEEARFNGGEPFLIKIYWDIWDMIIRINPGVMMVIATNGTVLNERIKDYMMRGNFNINLSIDGLTPDTYDKIRINGDIHKVLENFNWFRDFCRDNKRTLCVMVNPMRQNWHEMADLVNFCNENNVNIWYNTIQRPLDQAIWNLPASQLQEIYETLSAVKLLPNTKADRGIYKYNVATYKNLVEQQIKTWWHEARSREDAAKKYEDNGMDSKTTFENMWYPFLNQKFDDAGQRLKADEKLILLKNELTGESGEMKFYEILNGASPDVLLSNLLEYDMEKLKDRFRSVLSAV